MGTSRPTRTESIALWRAYNEMCVYCSRPIESLAILEIDHIIPKKLSETPDELRCLLDRLGVPNLDINSFLNWLPVHGRPCNRDKGDRIRSDTTLLNYLDLARQRENLALEEERKIRRQALNKNALVPLVHLIEAGTLSREEAISFIEAAIPHSSTGKKSDPLVLSFSVNVIDALSSGELPKNAPAPPDLYDWLETKLEETLRSAQALFARATRIEDHRNGETLSIRYAFWLLDLDLLPKSLPYQWELLEAAPFSEIYGDEDTDDLFAKGMRGSLKS